MALREIDEKKYRGVALAALEAAYHLRSIPTGSMTKDAMFLACDRARRAGQEVDRLLVSLGIAAGRTSLDADALKLRIMRGEVEL